MASQYRHCLPQLDGRSASRRSLRELFATDGGMETTMVFSMGQDLPHFAAFTAPVSATEAYYRAYLSLAARQGVACD